MTEVNQNSKPESSLDFDMEEENTIEFEKPNHLDSENHK